MREFFVSNIHELVHGLVALSGIISLFWAARVQPYVLVKERETEIKTKRSDGREREKIGE